MFKVGDKVRVKSSEAVGLIQKILSDEEVCVEFDHCVGTRTPFRLNELDFMHPADDVSGNVEIIQGDKGL